MGAIKVAKMGIEKKTTEYADRGFYVGWRRSGSLLFLFTLSASLFWAFFNAPFESSESTQKDLELRKFQNAKLLHAGTNDSATEEKNEVKEPFGRGKNQNEILIGSEEMTAILSAVKSADVGMRNKALAQIKAVASLESNLSEIKSSLLSVDASDEGFAPIVAALGAVGTPEVQRLLRDLLDARENDWRSFSAIISVLGLSENPNTETIEFLSAKTKHPDPDFASTAALALGALVHTLNQIDNKKGDVLLKTYIDKVYPQNANIEELKESIAVLGNAGLASTEASLLELVDHPRADVRAESIMSLRFIRTQNVEEVLLRRLDVETDLEVRLRGVEALMHGPVSERALETAVNLLTKKGTPSELRLSLLDLFLYSSLDVSKKKMFTDWLTKFSLAEADSKVRAKVALVIKEMLTER